MAAAGAVMDTLVMAVGTLLAGVLVGLLLFRRAIGMNIAAPGSRAKSGDRPAAVESEPEENPKTTVAPSTASPSTAAASATSSTPTPSSPRALELGTWVTVSGLRSRPELNGRRGRVDQLGERLCIHVDGNSSKLALKRSNVEANVEGPVCAQCGSGCVGPRLRCSRCRVTAYCSRECQSKAWSEHKPACELVTQQGALWLRVTRNSSEGHKCLAAGAQPSQMRRAAALFLDAAEGVAGARRAFSSVSAPGDAARAKLFNDACQALCLAPETAGAPETAREASGGGANGPSGSEKVCAALLCRRESELHNLCAQAHMAAGAFSEAGAAASRAAACARECDARVLHVEACTISGCAQLNGGDIDGARSTLREAVAMCAAALADGFGGTVEMTSAEASALSNLSRAILAPGKRQGCPREALGHIERAVVLRRRSVAQLERARDAGSGDNLEARLAEARRQLSSTLINCAAIVANADVDNAVANARASLEESLVLARRVSDVRNEQAALQGLVNLSHVGGARRPSKAPEAAPSQAHVAALNSLLERTGRRVEASCSICLEPLGTSDAELITLKCMHTFHRACIHRWCGSRSGGANSCPNCHGPIISY